LDYAVYQVVFGSAEGLVAVVGRDASKEIFCCGLYLEQGLGNLVEVEQVGEDGYQLQLGLLEGEKKEGGEPFAEVFEAVDEVVVGVKVVAEIGHEIGFSDAVEQIDYQPVFGTFLGLLAAGASSIGQGHQGLIVGGLDSFLGTLAQQHIARQDIGILKNNSASLDASEQMSDQIDGGLQFLAFAFEVIT
jgi:hypothetical protein